MSMHDEQILAWRSEQAISNSRRFQSLWREYNSALAVNNRIVANAAMQCLHELDMEIDAQLRYT
jgi:hypothetical protein